MHSRSSGIVEIVFAAAALAGCHHATVTSPSSASVGQPAAAAKVQAVRIGAVAAKALAPGGSVQLAATAQHEDGTEADVTGLAAWSSDNNAVATVSSSGLVSAAGPGSANIRADYQGVSGATPIDVAAPPVSSSDISPAPAPSPSPSPSPSPAPAPAPSPAPSPGPSTPPTVQSLTISGGTTVPMGRSLQLRATGHMSDGTDRDVTSSAQWSTSNPSVASVSQSGLLTGALIGPNVVTAQYNGTTASQPVQVTPF